jgi:hypothetical protein
MPKDTADLLGMDNWLRLAKEVAEGGLCKPSPLIMHPSQFKAYLEAYQPGTLPTDNG